MADLAKSTIAFLSAMRLEEGFKEEYFFNSKKEADSFRSSLYKVRNKLGDNSVLVSIEGTVVSLLKAARAVEKRRIAPDGSVVLITEEKDDSQYKKEIEEILESAEGMPESQKDIFIKDALDSLNSSRRAM